ncbi:hypothetical protein PYW07_006289 [Mythimna separata]|uniref:DDE Tnp4 domain-containing protein n=1 Tax=Mythimna separata TaxID=271217 RepID=A0AAD7YUL6_MYTSE|nr:hypothetical protein PYW07_006289 [Mythimna separata]
MRNPVEPIEMLGITLRYLGSGNSLQDLEYKFKRGKSTIRYMIRRVCRAIWKNILQDNIPELTTERLKNIASSFDLRANFPHCIGALDGKHIRMRNPANNRDGFRQKDKLAITDDEFHSLQPQDEEMTAANVIRDEFASYFMSDRGSLQWQLQKI